LIGQDKQFEQMGIGWLNALNRIYSHASINPHFSINQLTEITKAVTISCNSLVFK
jgi:hypothetical protein